MTNSLSENDEEQATMLVFGQPLPPSSLDKKFVEVKRHHKVIWAEAPPVLQDFECSGVDEHSFSQEHFQIAAHWTPEERLGSFTKIPVLSLGFWFSGHFASRTAHCCQLVPQS
jgi:hypothetical protein